MTERERWVVYPLLFLALGAALRDKLVDRTTTKSIVCQELTVVEEEPIGHQPSRILAKIGRADSKAGSPAGGYFLINGNLEIIDDDPAGIHPPRSLVKIGRTDPSPGAVSSGFAMVIGQVIVDGAINAKQYAYQGVPFMPAFQALPGISVPDLLRAIEQAAERRQKRNAPAAKTPQADSPTHASPATEPQPGGSKPSQESQSKE